MEKALAKYHGNYHHIVDGNSKIAARTLSGAPFTIEEHKKSGVKPEDITGLWDKLVK